MNKLILLLALAALLTTKGYAQKPDVDEDGNPVEWYQGFESTTIPTGWVQTIITKTSGGVDLYWRFQAGGGYISNPALKDPAAAYKGNYNALFFTHDDQASTMLETPWWNITSDKPAVAFWLTQVSRVGVDALTIQYSIKQPNGSYGTWQSLETFTTAQEGWARKIVALPDAVKGKNIKIGFVGELNMGLGICLDEVMIVDLTSKPRQINSLMLYHNSLVSPTGTSNNPVAMLETSVVGASNNLKVSQLNLTYTGTNISDISSLKLYVTRSNVFTTESPINATYSNTGNNLQIIVGDPTTSPSLLTGLNYIWVCANINTSATHGNSIKFTLPVNGFTTKLYNSISGLLEETKQYPLLLQSPSGESTIEESIFVDEFESGTAKWSLGTNMQVGLPTGVGNGNPQKAFSGSNILSTNLSGNYPPNIAEGSTDYIATTQTINAKYYKNISVRFRRWLNIESKDKVGMWLSTDNGATWKKVYENIFGVSDNYWTSQSFDISSEATRKEQVKFKLGIASSDGADERGGLNIENFAITGDYIGKDVGVESYISPTSSCNLGVNVMFTINLRNYGAESVSGPFNVGFSVNEGEWVYSTFNGTIGVGASQNFTFTTGANLSEYGVKNIRFKTMLNGDEDASNDMKSTAIYSYPTITAPITESFEVLLNHWYPHGTNSSWQWGAPSGTIINKAGHSTSAWVTKLNGNYNLSELSYLESPCYTLPVGEQNMVFSFMHKAALEEGVDGFTVQYSTNGGNTWNVLPKHATYSDNWLPTSSITALGLAGWSANTDYVVSKTLLPPAAISAGTVKFRFIFASNATNVNEGVAVDYVRLYALTNDIGISSLVDPTTDCEIGLSPLTFKLKNFSAVKEQPAGAVPITFSVNGSTPVTETYTLASPLAANTEVTLSATTKTYDFDKGTTFDIVAYTSLSNDDNKTNDKLETTINVTGMPNYQVVGADLGVIGLPSITTYDLDAGIGYDSYLWKRWNGSVWVDIGSSRIVTINSIGRYQITVQKGSCYKTVEVQVVLSNVDVQVVSFSGITDACTHTATEKPSVSIKNNGSSLLPEGTVIPVAIFINGVKTLEENVTIPTGGLAAGGSLPYTFITGIDLTEAQAYPIKIGTRYVGDINYTNDFTAEQTINTWGSPTVHVKAYNKTNIGVNPVDIEQGTVLKTLQPDTVSLDAGIGYATYKWERKLFGSSTWAEIGTSQMLTIDQNNSADYRLTATTMHSCGDAIVEFAINAKDLGISSIEGLEENYCQTEEGITFNVIIQNYGLDSYLEGTNINLVFNTPVGIQYKTVVLEAGSALPSGGSLTVAVPSPINLGVGLNPIRISTDMDDDCEPSNDSYDVSVMVKAAPTVTINPNVIKAVFNSSSELAINPIYSSDCEQFSWSHGPTTRNIIIYGIPAPEYTVTSTNADGCSASAKVNIISTDISVSSLVSPISKCELIENNTQAQITILNSGSIPFETGTTIRLKIYVDNVLVTNGEEDLVLSNQLAAGQTIPFTFSNVNMQTALTGKSTADIKVEATLIGIEDINPANNTLINTIHSTGYPSISLGLDKDVHAWTQALSATPDPGYASYSWSFALSPTGTFESVGTNPTYTASQEQPSGKGSGTYKLTVTDAYGCSGTATTNLTFFVDDLEVIEVINPTSGCNKTNNETISINLRNNSSWDFPVGTNYQLGVKIGANAEVIEGHTLGAMLAKNTSIEKALTTKADLYTIMGSTSTDIIVRVIFPTDMVASNNSKTKTVESYPPVAAEIAGGIDEIEYTTISYELDMSGYESVEWTLSGGLVLVDGTLTSAIIKVSGTGNACVKAYNMWGCFAEDCAHLTYKNPDLTITDIVAPVGGCNQTASETISVTIKNVGVVTFNAGEYIPLQLKSIDPDAVETNIDGGFLLPANLEPNNSFTRTFDNNINLTKAGTYQLTASVSHASDENTSNNSKLKTIESHPVVVVNLGSNRDICQGNTTILDAGNAGAQSFAWTKDGSALTETGQTLTVNSSGLYSVVVTSDKGCTGTSSVTVNVNPTPTVNLGNDATLCSDQSLTLDAGNPGATYLWSTSATSSTITVTSSGTYSVTVTNSYNCSSSDEIVVTFSAPPTVTHAAVTPVCVNATSVTLTGGSPSGGVYTGPGTNGTSNFNPSVAGVGTHTLTYAYTNQQGCSASIPVQITVNNSPTVDLGLDRSTTTPLTLDAGNGFISYKWQDNTTNRTYTVSATGIYSVTVTDANGCTGYDEVNITYIEKFDVYVSSLTSPISKCFNNTGQPVTVELTNRGGIALNAGDKIDVNYQIGTNQPVKEQITLNSTLSPNGKMAHTFGGTALQNSGNYSITCYTTIGGEDGAKTSYNVSIYPLPNLDLGPDTLRRSVPYVLQSGIGSVSYLWNTGATSGSITVSQHGKYWLRVTDANSCVASDTIIIWWPVSAEIISGIDAKIKLFPNPVKNELNVWIESEKAETYTLELINPQGLIVRKQQTISSDKITDIIKVEDLTSGMYILRISTDKGSGAFKVIVENY